MINCTQILSQTARRSGGVKTRIASETPGAPEAWRLVRYDCGHEETPEMRAEIIRFLRRWL